MEAMDPKGIDIAFWLNWIMTATGQDASAMQVDALRSPMIKEAIDFRRFQISLDPESIKKLPNTDQLSEKKYGSKWMHDLDEKILGGIDMADVTRFDLMKVIGTQMAQYIMEENKFQDDLADKHRDKLVTAFGDTVRIRTQMASAKWLDSFKS
jgi:hypothetical protein